MIEGLTENQIKGLFLEIATFLALQNLGIQPQALHNPFSEEYAEDQHLMVDLIFIHDNLCFGVECKNFSSKSHVGVEFMEKEVIGRFENCRLPFAKRVIVFGVLSFRMIQSLPEEYDIIKLGYQVRLENINEAIRDMTKQFRLYLSEIRANLELQKVNVDYDLTREEEIEISRGLLKGADMSLKKRSRKNE